MPWIVETLNGTVDQEIEALPADMRAYLQRIVGLIESHGLEYVHEPYLKHLRASLWEMRLKGQTGISRAIYVTAAGQRVVIVRVFIKRTRATPRREIELATKRAKEVS